MDNSYKIAPNETAERTAFITALTAEAENLILRARAPMLKEQCMRVFEALRYSPRMSHEALGDVERRIKDEFDLLTDAVISDDLDKTESSADELVLLVTERNNKAKLAK